MIVFGGGGNMIFYVIYRPLHSSLSLPGGGGGGEGRGL
jgi:hypothetical protein